MELKDITNEVLRNALLNNEYNTVIISYNKEGAKWVEKELDTDLRTYEQKKRFLSSDTLRWFKNLGGKEIVKQGRLCSYGATINISIAPDGSEKKVTYFLF